jgi:hypothetical protein
MIVRWLKLVANKLNNKIMLIDWKGIFIIVFQFYCTTGCPVQKKKWHLSAVSHVSNIHTCRVRMFAGPHRDMATLSSNKHENEWLILVYCPNIICQSSLEVFCYCLRMSTKILPAVPPGGMGWKRHVAWRGLLRSFYGLLVENPEERGSFWRARHGWGMILFGTVQALGTGVYTELIWLGINSDGRTSWSPKWIDVLHKFLSSNSSSMTIKDHEN